MTHDAAAAGALLLLAACGSGQWREADARLQRAAEPARAAGMAPLPGRNNEFGTFVDTGTVRWTVTLEAERAYFLAAVCTGGCRGLDLTLTMPDGRTVGRDSSADTETALSFQAPSAGAHAVRLRVGGCAEGTCRWAAQLYAQPD